MTVRSAANHSRGLDRRKRARMLLVLVCSADAAGRRRPRRGGTIEWQSAQEDHHRRQGVRAPTSPIRSAPRRFWFGCMSGISVSAQAKDDGSDLRFVAGDDKTPLKHHVEKYDSLLGEALVWVSVAEPSAGRQDRYLALLRQQESGCDRSDAKGTYDPDTQLVYHFNDRGTPALDSSVWANNAQSVGQPADGSLIGTGLRLDGRTALTLPASPSLALSDSAATDLVGLDQAGRDATQCGLVQPPRRRQRSRHRTGQRRAVRRGDQCRHRATQRRRRADRAGQLASSSRSSRTAVRSRSISTALLTRRSARRCLRSTTIGLVGGDTAASAAPWQRRPRPHSLQPRLCRLRTAPRRRMPRLLHREAAPASAPVAAMAGFAGDIDELQIAKIARPAGFIKLAAIGQGPEQAKLDRLQRRRRNRQLAHRAISP